MRCRLRFALVSWAACVCVLSGFAPAFAIGIGGGPWTRPVNRSVARAFDAPRTRFGPGHLGVDFATGPATAVRAAGDGVVVFAGRVGAELHVVVRHDDDVRTTVSFLETLTVVVGQIVERGQQLGTSGGTGPSHTAGVLHFSVRVGTTYVDPMLLFAPVDLGAVVHLAAPHGGPAAAAGAAAPSGPAADGERSAIRDALRIDARPTTVPPSWWSEAAARAAPTQARGPTMEPTASPNLTPAISSRAGPGNAGSVTAVIAATLASVGGLSVAARGWRRHRFRLRGS